MGLAGDEIGHDSVSAAYTPTSPLSDSTGCCQASLRRLEIRQVGSAQRCMFVSGERCVIQHRYTAAQDHCGAVPIARNLDRNGCGTGQGARFDEEWH